VSGLRILVCVKRVPAPGAQITLTADARAALQKQFGDAGSGTSSRLRRFPF